MKKLILITAVLLAIGGGSANAAASLCDTVAGNLLQNCGFESGTFSNWNTGPASSGTDFGVNGPGHTGSFDAFFGANAGMPDTISQTVLTTPGHLYDLQFYLKSDGLTPNGAFVGYFNASLSSFIVLGGGTDIPQLDWTLVDFTFTATNPSTFIKFGAQDGPGALLLDDLVLRDITEVPEPFTLGIFGAGLAGAFAMRRRKHNSA